MSTPPTADDAQCELDRIHVKLQEFSEVGLDDDLLSDWIDAEVKELPRFVRANHVKVVLTAIKGWKEKSLVSETKAADLQRMVFNARPREPPKPSTLIVSKNKPPLLPRAAPPASGALLPGELSDRKRKAEPDHRLVTVAKDSEDSDDSDDEGNPPEKRQLLDAATAAFVAQFKPPPAAIAKERKVPLLKPPKKKVIHRGQQVYVTLVLCRTLIRF